MKLLLSFNSGICNFSELKRDKLGDRITWEDSGSYSITSPICLD